MPSGVYVRTEEHKKKNSQGHITHGGKGTRLYKTWSGMKARCHNPAYYGFKHYGGRGITVHPEWIGDFAAFREFALAHGYTDSLTIDRIDSNGDYEPGNIRFVPNSENCVRRSYDNIFKAVTQYDLAGMLVASFTSITEASKQTNINTYAIGAVCSGKRYRKTAGGFVWQFA